MMARDRKDLLKADKVIDKAIASGKATKAQIVKDKQLDKALGPHKDSAAYKKAEKKLRAQGRY